MKTKLKEIKEDFYAFSSKTSDITRQLALAGIAIIWIFRITENDTIKLLPQTVQILKLLVLCLLFDFCHAFIPSFTYGFMTSIFKRNGKVDDDVVEYNQLWTIPEWAFFVIKIIFLVWAYIILWIFLNSNLIQRTHDASSNKVEHVCPCEKSTSTQCSKALLH